MRKFITFLFLQDLHYQASMFESSFGDGYYEGEVIGIEKASRNIALNLAKEGVTVEVIAKVTGLSELDVKQILSELDHQART